MKVGSLFSGCQGLDLGLGLAGLETIWACESDAACRRVIARHHPDLPIYDDVRMFSEAESIKDVPYVDVIAGGFPCQDLSQAGPGGGLAGERSGLWFSMRDAIRNLRPRYVVIENVPGLATKMGARPGESALATVIADLAEAGYVGSWLRLRASDVGAPHKRERVFIIAHTTGAGHGSLGGGSSPEQGGSPWGSEDENHIARSAGEGGLQAALHAALADSGSERFDGAGIRDAQAATEEGNRRSGPARSEAFAPDSDGERRAQHRRSIADEETLTPLDGDSEGRRWGIYAPAVLLWEKLFRPAPHPTDDRGRLNPEFSEWMLGFPHGWTEGESRTQRLRMLGNAVQVQVGEVIGRMLLEEAMRV